MESRPAQAVFPLVGLAADKLVRDRHTYRRSWILLPEEQLAGLFTIDIEFIWISQQLVLDLESHSTA